MSIVTGRARNFSITALVTFLLVLGLGPAIHRHMVFEVPWTPGEENVVWSVEATIEFFATGGPVSVELVRPTSQKGFTVLDESGASPGYGLSFAEDDGQPTVNWTVRDAQGRQTLYYRVDLFERNGEGLQPHSPPPLQAARWEEPYQTAVDAVLSRAYDLSADPYSLATQLVASFEASNREQSEQLLVDGIGEENLPELLSDMLQTRGIHAAPVAALRLEDGRRRQQLVTLLRVWSGDDSRLFDVASPRRDSKSPILLWQPTRGYVLEVAGGQSSSVSFSMLRSTNTRYGELARAPGTTDPLQGFSIYALPIEEQAMFKSILLIPIGALVVCILRILVGIRTSGTFMPVLIALAFIETSLLTGVVGFVLVVASGLLVRSYMSHLNLLLVARISVVMIAVISIIALFSVFSYQVGLTEGLKITFFPIIILSWTVERISILWEEEGGREVAIQASGSLLTALAAYLAMTNPWIRHLSFNFVSLQLVVLAAIIMLGNYSGYRLLELRRFSAITAENASSK